MIDQETYFAFAEWIGDYEDWIYRDDIEKWCKFGDVIDMKVHYEDQKTTAELFEYWSDNIKKIKNY